MKKITTVLFGALMLTFVSASFAETDYTSVCVHNDSAACVIAFDYTYEGPNDPNKYTVFVSSTSATTVSLHGNPSMWVINAHCKSDSKTMALGTAVAGQTVYCSGGAVGKVTCSLTDKWDCGSKT